MKQWKGTFIALIVLIALGAYVGYFVWGGHGKSKKSTPTPTLEPVLSGIKEKDVTDVIIAGAPKVMALRKQKDGWKVLSPKKHDGDDRKIDRALSHLISASPTRVITGTKDLRGFGLDSPKWYITLKTSQGKVVTLRIGNQNPSGVSYYVQLEGEKDKIYMIPTFPIDEITAFLNKPPLKPTPTPVAKGTPKGGG